VIISKAPFWIDIQPKWFTITFVITIITQREEKTMPRPKMYPGETTVALSIRLPEELREIIQQRAIRNRRSLNQEIVHLLERAVRQQRESEPESTEQ
jgi:hypothetical protein